jgi:hypothetical protein
MSLAPGSVCLNPAMPEAASLLAIRAAVEVIVPLVDGDPGAADLGVDRHVAEAIEQYLPGFVDLLGTLLDAYAADVRAGAAFVSLTADERSQVLRAMCREEGPDMQDIVDGLLVFTFGGMYSEWTGFDRATGTLEPPQVWASIGFGGRSDGYPEYRQGI